MKFLLSPAKTLDYETVYLNLPHSEPRLLEYSTELIQELRTLSEDEISTLMSLSEKLSKLNSDRYQSWDANHALGKECRPALLAFKGDVYQGLDVASWSEDDFHHSQQHLRILSGLYGILRPLDLMRPYRLEMGTKLATGQGKNLYEFWGSLITKLLASDLESDEAVVNLASNEYFSSVKTKELPAPIITPVFKDYKNGKYKIIAFYAKRARGSMASWAIKNKINTPEDLKNFTEDGYAYNKDESNENQLVFLRNVEKT